MKRKHCIVPRTPAPNKQKKRKCIACNGSGRYDNTGSPKCGVCNGTGKERI